MAYKIVYGFGECEKVTIARRKRHWLPWVGCALASLAIGIALIVPQARAALRNWILPGDAAVTADALGELVEDLKEGEGISDAVSAFCIQIITESGQ